MSTMRNAQSPSEQRKHKPTIFTKHISGIVVDREFHNVPNRKACDSHTQEMLGDAVGSYAVREESK